MTERSMKSSWSSPGHFSAAADRHGDGAEMLLSVCGCCSWSHPHPPPITPPPPPLLLCYLYKDSQNIPSQAFHVSVKIPCCAAQPKQDRTNGDVTTSPWAAWKYVNSQSLGRYFTFKTFAHICSKPKRGCSNSNQLAPLSSLVFSMKGGSPWGLCVCVHV